MSKILKKGNKLLETIHNSVPMDKIAGLQDFYMMKQGTHFAIRDVQAYHIKNTDMVLVLGSLDLASRTAKQAAEKRKARQAELLKQYEETAQKTEEENNSDGSDDTDAVEDVQEKEETTPELSITEDDIKVVMEQGGISTRDEAVKLLKEHGGDPLAILMALGK